LVEIIREFRNRFDEDGGGGGGGVSPSSIAGSGPPDPPEPPPSPPEPPELEGVLTRMLLTLQKDVKELNRKLDKIAASKTK
jgi:hypothetical protein